MDIGKKCRKRRPVSNDYLKKFYAGISAAPDCMADLRYRENMTQDELAKIIGVNQTHISQIENGERTIGDEVAKQLASIFDVTFLH